MILSITFSKPSKDCERILGKPYIRVKIRRTADSALKRTGTYEAEFFTEKQVFQKHMTSSEVEAFLKQHAGVTFKNVTERTDTEEITILTNRHGQTTTLKKNASGKTSGNEMADNQGPQLFTASSKKTKKYIMEEGTPVPFLVKLGVMTKEGKVVSQKYDKFRQINRFLEYIADILDDVQRLCTGTRGFTK